MSLYSCVQHALMNILNKADKIKQVGKTKWGERSRGAHAHLCMEVCVDPEIKISSRTNTSTCRLQTEGGTY